MSVGLLVATPDPLTIGRPILRTWTSLVLLPMHTSDYLPRFTLGTVFTGWELSAVLALLTLAAAGLYAAGVNRLAQPR